MEAAFACYSRKYKWPAGRPSLLSLLHGKPGFATARLPSVVGHVHVRAPCARRGLTTSARTVAQFSHRPHLSVPSGAPFAIHFCRRRRSQPCELFLN